jgi:hypothetical protein
MPSPARVLAFNVLRRVESGAWASELLLAHSVSLDSRDASLAAEIVFGVPRFGVPCQALAARSDQTMSGAYGARVVFPCCSVVRQPK